MAVTATNTTPNIDFALDSGGRISGKVTNAATGAALSGAGVEFFNASGVDVGWTFADSQGNYTSAGLPTGSY